MPARACACAAAAAASRRATRRGRRTHAAEPRRSSHRQQRAHASTGGASIVRTIVGLAIVIAVIWGLSWILRQVKAGRDPQASSARPRERRRAHARLRALGAPRARRQRLRAARQRRARPVPIHRYTEEQAREAGLLDGARRAARALGRRRRSPQPPPARAGRPDQRHDPMRMPAPGSERRGRAPARMDGAPVNLTSSNAVQILLLSAG